MIWLFYEVKERSRFTNKFSWYKQFLTFRGILKYLSQLFIEEFSFITAFNSQPNEYL